MSQASDRLSRIKKGLPASGSMTLIPPPGSPGDRGPNPLGPPQPKILKMSKLKKLKTSAFV